MAHYHIVHTPEGYHFACTSSDGKELLHGPGCHDLAVCEAGIAQVKACAATEQAYQRRVYPDGQYGFALTGPDGTLLATSARQASVSQREAAIEAVKAQAPTATVVPYAKQRSNA